MTEPDSGDAVDYDGALPGAETELAPSASETEAHTAWALDDGADWEPRWWTSTRVTTAAVATAVLAAVAVAVLAGYHLQPSRMAAEPTATSAAPTTRAVTTSAAKPEPPPVTVTTVVVQEPPKTVTRQAAPPPAQGPIDSANLPPAPTVLPALVPFDDDFIATIQRNGFAIYDRTLVLKQAHASCSMLRAGEHPDLVSRKLLGVNPDINWQMATQFVGIVRGVYPGCVAG